MKIFLTSSRPYIAFLFYVFLSVGITDELIIDISLSRGHHLRINSHSSLCVGRDVTEPRKISPSCMTYFLQW